MKTARFVLKIVSASLALASFVCAIIGFWEELRALDAMLLHYNRRRAVPTEEIGIG